MTDTQNLYEIFHISQDLQFHGSTSLTREYAPREPQNESGVRDEETVKLDKRLAALSREMATRERVMANIRHDMEQNSYRRQSITEHYKKCQTEITDQNAPDYFNFQLNKWVLDAEWRQGRKALVTYYKRGGKSIDADISNFEGQQTSLDELGSLYRGSQKLFKTLTKKKNDLVSVPH